MNLTANQENQATARIEQASNTIDLRIPETWNNLIVPYQNEPSIIEPFFEHKTLSGGKGSLAERAGEKCVQEDYIFEQIGARIIRDKLNEFLWKDKSHVQVRELIDWCRKYLYLPRIANDQVILNSLINPMA